MKARIEQYFHVVLFIILYKVILTFKSVDETLVCDHLNESYWAEFSYGAIFVCYKRRTFNLWTKYLAATIQIAHYFHMLATNE